MIVKICGITRREDAQAAVDAGANALGFVFVPRSPRYVTPERAAELGRGFNVWKVGVFEDQPVAAVEAAARVAGLDVAQLYGGETPAGVRVWRAFRVKNGIDRDLARSAEAVLLDGPSNGLGFDWNEARGVAEKVIVAGGLNPENVAEAVRIAKPWGVDVSSGIEQAPGIKDHDKIRRFIRAAQEAA